MARKHTQVSISSHTPMTVIPKNTRTDKYYTTINNNDKQKVRLMTTQYANNYSQVRTPPYLEIQSYRILNYHVTQLAN